MRQAEFVLFTEETSEPELYKSLGYSEEIKAVCLLNYRFVVFTVREDTYFFSKRKSYNLFIALPLLITGRAAGNKTFESLDAAIDFGKQYIKEVFPEIDAE